MFYSISRPSRQYTGEGPQGPCMMWGWLLSPLPWHNTTCNNLFQAPMGLLWVWDITLYRFLWAISAKCLIWWGAGSEPLEEEFSRVILMACAVWHGKGHDNMWMTAHATLGEFYRMTQGRMSDGWCNPQPSVCLFVWLAGWVVFGGVISVNYPTNCT